VYFAQPTPPNPFSSSLNPAPLLLGTSVGGTQTTKGLMLGAERRRRKEGRKEAMPSAREGNETKDESGEGRAAGGPGAGARLKQGLLSRGVRPSLTKLPPAFSIVALSQVGPTSQNKYVCGGGALKIGKELGMGAPSQPQRRPQRFSTDALARECRLVIYSHLTSPGHSETGREVREAGEQRIDPSM
jgi:hypothetical protein